MTESEKAKRWREAQRLTQAELAALTGYSLSAIALFERGRNSASGPHDPQAWQRYKLACLAVATLRYQHVESIDRWQWR
jgi:transcriptional regulator with XRE-family HTH domain